VPCCLPTDLPAKCCWNLLCAVQRVELLYLRAICHHALGYVRQAVRDYEACLTYVRPAVATSPVPAGEDGSSSGATSSRELSEEARGFQFLSFYQKEVGAVDQFSYLLQPNIHSALLCLGSLVAGAQAPTPGAARCFLVDCSCTHSSPCSCTRSWTAQPALSAWTLKSHPCSRCGALGWDRPRVPSTIRSTVQCTHYSVQETHSCRTADACATRVAAQPQLSLSLNTWCRSPGARRGRQPLS
jgi:hypothetical protein